jgi:hypothetical protein
MIALWQSKLLSEPVTDQVTTNPGRSRRNATVPDRAIPLPATTRQAATSPDETGLHGKEKVYGSIP